MITGNEGSGSPQTSANRRVRIVEVEPRAEFRLWLRYEDGVAGEVNLSESAKLPLFQGWHDDAPFEAVGLSPSGLLVWNDDIDLCGDALYLELTGQSPADLFPAWLG